MSLPHLHSEMCPPRCTRTEDVDPRTTTGAYHIVSKTVYGRRPGDKPRWWPFAFHAYKAIIQVVTVLGLAWVLKRLGLTAP